MQLTDKAPKPRIRIFHTQEDADQVANYRRVSCGEKTRTEPITYAGKSAVKLISWVEAV